MFGPPTGRDGVVDSRDSRPNAGSVDQRPTPAALNAVSATPITSVDRGHSLIEQVINRYGALRISAVEHT
jgi:hypothetical protein